MFENEEELAKTLFRIFKKENESHRFKVVNMLEVFTALILLADFSSHTSATASAFDSAQSPLRPQLASATPLTSSERLQAQADLIEHKVNLLILLFSFRGGSSSLSNPSSSSPQPQPALNIAEIMILAKTAVHSLERVFPEVPLFKAGQVQEEVKQMMLGLFQGRIEERLKEEKIKQQQLMILK
jgi:hypothetical protein